MKLAVVTGGNAGLGLACAERIAARPRLAGVLACRDPARGQGGRRRGRGARAAPRGRDRGARSGVAGVGAPLRRQRSPARSTRWCSTPACRWSPAAPRPGRLRDHLRGQPPRPLPARQPAAAEDGARRAHRLRQLRHPRSEEPAPACRRRATPIRRIWRAAPICPGESPAPPGRRRYTTSKLCNVLCAYELRAPSQRCRRQRLRPRLHAGDRAGARLRPARALRLRVRAAGADALRPQRQSRRHLGRAAGTSRRRRGYDGVSGRYFTRGREARSSADSYDEARARSLWDASAAMTGLAA